MPLVVIQPQLIRFFRYVRVEDNKSDVAYAFEESEKGIRGVFRQKIQMAISRWYIYKY